MGAADVVPGVSGGTIAFITGIYEQLITALSALSPAALRVLCQRGPAAFWRHVHGTFLCVLVSGIIFGVATLVRLVNHLLAFYPLPLWGFFFGLIIASVVFVWRQAPVRGAPSWFALVLGAGAMLALVFMPTVQLQASLPVVFVSGMVAICAMILPGVSGSFILLMLGVYPEILGAVARFDVVVLLVFVAGCATGLLSFSRLLQWLLGHYHRLTLAVLTGLLIGSLAAVWPWRVMMRQVSTTGDPERVLVATEVLSPWLYAERVGEPQLLLVVCAAAVGLGLVFMLETSAARFQRA